MLDLGRELGESTNLKGDQLLFSRLLYPANSNEAEQLKAIRFPNEEHVYLVNNRPVITFWGFTEKNQTPYADPFLCLRPKAPDTSFTPPPSQPVPPIIPVEKHKCRWWMWLLPLLLLLLLGLAFYFLRPYFFSEENLTPSATATQVADTSADKEKTKKPCLNPVTYYRVGPFLRDEQGKIKLLPRSCDIIVEEDQFPYKQVGDQWVNRVDGKPIADQAILRNLAETTKPTTEESAVENGGVSDNLPAQSIDPNQTNLTDPIAGNIEDNANIAPDNDTGLGNQSNALDNDALNGKDDKNGNEAIKGNNSANNTLPPIDPLNQGAQGNNPANPANVNGNPNGKGNNLSLDPTALAKGKTDFLNGNWSAGSGIQDKATGKPLKLNYSFDNGKGKVNIQRGDGVTCQGNVQATASSGGLNINNNGIATCTDGSTYQLPAVSCKPTGTGEADCSGVYGMGKKFPISMKSK